MCETTHNKKNMQIVWNGESNLLDEVIIQIIIYLMKFEVEKI